MKKVGMGEVEGTNPEGTKGVVFRQLLAKNVDAPNFYLRLFDVAPGGNTPLHSHDWEHEVFVVSGRGKIVLADSEHPLAEGDAVLVQPNEVHQFVNDTGSLMRMICVIPRPKE
ncbi:TPA: cupin domain-containing protein [Thermoplasmata archaeon]|nr:cupin domain-containing protein [Thermoplasmata archaeon]